MPSATAVRDVFAREVLDSRGNPTLEADVRLVGGAHGPATAAVDGALRAADGTESLSRLGANAVLAVSLASAHAAAAAAGKPLYRFVGERFGTKEWRLPVPMLNVLNGGVHADNGQDVQEVMVAPTGFSTFAEALRAGAETYAALKALLKARKASTAVGDEGGFAPRLGS